MSSLDVIIAIDLCEAALLSRIWVIALNWTL